MNEHDRAESECTFEVLKEEHRRALEAEDIEALERVQGKLSELMARERASPEDGVGPAT